MVVDWVAPIIGAILALGIDAPVDLIADGLIHRFSTNGRHGDDAGWYVIHILANGHVVAHFGCHRADVRGHWYSKTDNMMQLREMQKVAKKLTKQAERTMEKERLPEIRKLWESLPPITAETTHPYLTRKGIAAVPKIMAIDTDGRLVVGMYGADMDLHSVQYISDSGVKRYAWGLPAQGLWAPIGARPAAGAWLYVGEGIATCISIHVLTGCTAICAFSAAQLECVALQMQKRYPDAKIVIAGDRGKVGVKATIAAAKAIDGYLVIPPADVQEGLSDWNDMHRLDADRARSALLAPKKFSQEIDPVSLDPELGTDNWSDYSSTAPNEPSEPTMDNVVVFEKPVKLDPQWKDRLLRNASMRPVPCEQNVMLALHHMPELAGLFARDEFGGKDLLMRRPPWVSAPTNGKGDGHKWPAAYRDEDAVCVAALLQDKIGINVTPAKVAACVSAVSFMHRFDPLQDMLHGLVWDNVPRIDTWLCDICGVEDTPYARAVSANFLISAVARALRPGCRVDTVLVLEGAQGILKSTLVSILGLGFSGDLHIDPSGGKGTPELFGGKWIIEFAELAGLRRAESDRLKAFVSRRIDTYRAAYARTSQDHPRRVVFVGTVNEELYLQDQTGNRRWWPVQVRFVDVERLEREVQQLWAEAVTRFKAGGKWWLTPQLEQDAVIEQQSRVESEAWEAPFADWLERQIDPHVTTTRDCLIEAVKLPIREHDVYAMRRAATALKGLGYVRTEYRTRGRDRLYIHADILDDRRRCDPKRVNAYLLKRLSDPVAPAPDWTAMSER